MYGICGTAPCATFCPLKRPGRLCPDVADYLDELELIGLTPADVAHAASPA